MEGDSHLVFRAQKGDPLAFAELVRRHRNQVFYLCLSILGPGFATDAEDLTQDVFLRVHLTISTFRGESEFSSWLYRMTYNQAVNLKSKSRFKTPSLGETALLQLVSREPSPEKQAESNQLASVLSECINELSSVYQSVLRLYYWLGKSIGEISELLSLPENTVKSHLHRARQQLQRMLSERGFNHE